MTYKNNYKSIQNIPSYCLGKGFGKEPEKELLRNDYVTLFTLFEMEKLKKYIRVTSLAKLLENSPYHNNGRTYDTPLQLEYVRYPLILKNDNKKLIFFEFTGGTIEDSEKKLNDLCNSLNLKYYIIKSSETHPLDRTTRDYGFIMTKANYEYYQQKGIIPLTTHR